VPSVLSANLPSVSLRVVFASLPKNAAAAHDGPGLRSALRCGRFVAKSSSLRPSLSSGRCAPRRNARSGLGRLRVSAVHPRRRVASLPPGLAWRDIHVRRLLMIIPGWRHRAEIARIPSSPSLSPVHNGSCGWRIPAEERDGHSCPPTKKGPPRGGLV